MASRPLASSLQSPAAGQAAGSDSVAKTSSRASRPSQSAIRPTCSSAGVEPTSVHRPSWTIAAPPASTRSSRTSDWRTSPSTKSSRSVIPARSRACAALRPIRCSNSARRAFAATWSESIWPTRSHAVRTSKGTRWGARLWQEISPQSRPSSRIEADIDDPVPMLTMDSTWAGETPRSAAKPRSSGRPVAGLSAGTSGTGAYPESGISRRRLARYRARACAGMSDSGNRRPR